MTNPHEAAPDEDPEAHIGQEVPDPWDEGGVTEVLAALPSDWPLWFGKPGGDE